MSLLEDVLDVLRMVLEYFGVPQDILVPVWDSQLCGQYRSIVRMIGTNLPLKPPPRVHFQISLINHRPSRYLDVNPAETPAIPSFADVMWVFDDEGDSYTRTRNHLPPKKQINVNGDLLRYTRPALSAQRGRGPIGQTVGPDAAKKITALENELLKLRAQIAMIVTAAPVSGVTESQKALHFPLMSPPRPPALTSTPRCTAPPPPPPPPPPPCPSSSTDTPSVLELIRQRRKNEDDSGQLQPQDSGLSRGSETKGMPSMQDVLKDLNKVKLRSVKRSPGGTPFKRRSSKGAALPNDPAALIAEALKRKFAQHHLNSSSDKENSLEPSPFSSPEMPRVSLHTRRSQGRRHF